MCDYTILVEKEYKKLNSSSPTIGALMMVKDEHERILVSLQSIKDYVDCLIVYDTGSTDNTIDIIKNFCETNKLNLYLIQGTFVNFSISRNISLEYADKIPVHYLLLLDCNDELRGGEHLKKFVKDYFHKDNTGFLICQEWVCSTQDKYFNMRLVKARNGWRYHGSVHEWMKDTSQKGEHVVKHPVIRMPENIVLYQDRTKDNNKSIPRFTRDRDLLLQDLETEEDKSRTLFYLAQTCHCMGKFDEALYYSKLRLEEKGFEEERSLSFIRCGDCCLALKQPWEVAMTWYLKCYEHMERIEPLIKIADYYRGKKIWGMAYMFAKEALRVKYPDKLILFFDQGMNIYYKWYVMSIVAFHTGNLDEGKHACDKALETCPPDKKGDVLEVIKLYGENKKENKQTRKEFVDSTVKELKVKFPESSEKILEKRAQMMWKKLKEK